MEQKCHNSWTERIRTKEIIAANRRILTRRSSNCSKTSCHMDFPEIAKSILNFDRSSIFLRIKYLHTQDDRLGKYIQHL